MPASELAKWYEEQYHEAVYQHSYEHDLEVAKARVEEYSFQDMGEGDRVLDVGCGSGAFVNTLLDKGVDAMGCDLSPTSRARRFFPKTIEQIHFPTDYFDSVVSFDVLEHMPNPKQVLEEIYRCLKPSGFAVLEIPHFWSRSGKHHWKMVEHLWMPTKEQMIQLLEEIGFEVVGVVQPISSKLAFTVHKLKQARISILVPPGVGDIYWSLLKAKSFCEQGGYGQPDIYISSPMKNARDRSIDYVRMCSWCNAAGYLKHDHEGKIWKEAYMHDGRTIFDNVVGCDKFIAYNGVMRYGASLSAVDPHLEPQWYFPMFESLEEQAAIDRYQNRYGRYVVCYIVPHGTYKRWLDEFDIKKTYVALREISDRLKANVVLVGAAWDRGKLDKILLRIQKAEGTNFIYNEVGRTSLEDVFGMMKGSIGVVGYLSGITIMSTRFKVPTLMLWNSYYHPDFWWHSCPPDSRDVWYTALDTLDLRVETVVRSFERLVKGQSTQPDWKDIASIKKESKNKSVTRFKKQKPIKVKKANGFKHFENLRVVVAGVYLEGNGFDERYVRNLFNQFPDQEKRLLTEHPLDIEGVECISIEGQYDHKRVRTWAKMELFREGVFQSGELVWYFDLDTVFMHTLNGQLQMAPKHGFGMLRSFRSKKRFASGIMCWRGGDFEKLWDAFLNSRKELMAKSEELGLRAMTEQQFIETQLMELYGVRPDPIQNVMNIVSWKRDCKETNTVPDKADVICFHGKPRPHNVDNIDVQGAWNNV
jgi:SAM-dependent methyltransferase